MHCHGSVFLRLQWRKPHLRRPRLYAMAQGQSVHGSDDGLQGCEDCLRYGACPAGPYACGHESVPHLLPEAPIACLQSVPILSQDFPGITSAHRRAIQGVHAFLVVLRGKSRLEFKNYEEMVESWDTYSLAN
jgi:hypothetical protein